MLNYQPSSLSGISALTGVEFNGFNLNDLTMRLYTIHLFNNSFKQENFLVINSSNIIDKIAELGYALGFSYKNNNIFEIKFMKNDIRVFINAKSKNITLLTSLNFISSINKYCILLKIILNIELIIFLVIII